MKQKAIVPSYADPGGLADEVARRLPRHQASKWAVVGNLDGKVTAGDVLISIFLLAACLAAGLLMAGVTWLANYADDAQPSGSAIGWLVNMSKIGVVLFVIRLAGDALDLQGWAGALMAGFWEWLATKGDNDGQPPSPAISITVPQGAGEFKLLGLSPAASARAVEFAKVYIALQERGETYPTAEGNFVGPGLIWSNASTGNGGRPGWQDFKSRLFDAKLAAKDPNNRWHLRDSGEWLMRELVNQNAGS